jgi:hypothetical protein
MNSATSRDLPDPDLPVDRQDFLRLCHDSLAEAARTGELVDAKTVIQRLQARLERAKREVADRGRKSRP